MASPRRRMKANWRSSFAGSHSSSESSNAKYAPLAAASPVLRAADTPRQAGWVSSRTRGSARAASPRRRVVGRAIVDDHHFQVVVGLGQGRGHGPQQHVRPVVGGQDDRYQDVAVWLLRRSLSHAADSTWPAPACQGRAGPLPSRRRTGHGRPFRPPCAAAGQARPAARRTFSPAGKRRRPTQDGGFFHAHPRRSRARLPAQPAPAPGRNSLPGGGGPDGPVHCGRATAGPGNRGLRVRRAGPGS